mmetsp:Transcript_26243/g.74334  ORF Transcript_26243/g.74334 Transcript_26243/m.74334 type:complete len:122 (-) Transcript_26243:304-669(-)
MSAMDTDSKDRIFTTPRVNAGLLPQYAGRRVVLVGRVLSSDPGTGFVDIQTSDDARARVMLVDAGEQLAPQQVYEFTGTVGSDNGLKEEVHVPFSDNFDLPNYDKMIRLAHDARYASMFWG